VARCGGFAPPHLFAIAILLAFSATELAAGNRAVRDQPDDDRNPHQLHLLYVLPAGATDRQLDTDGTITRSALAALEWLEAESGRTLRLDTRNGSPDITFVRLDRTDAQFREHENPVALIEWLLVAQGHIQPNKLYAAYYAGHYTDCAAAPRPPLTLGQVAVLAVGDAHCGQPLGANADLDHWEFTLIHEIFHLLGGVPDNTPHAVSGGHLLDNSHKDLMSDGSWDLPAILDRGRDDYWGHGQSDYADLSLSAFVTPVIGAGQLPPGSWPIQRPLQQHAIPNPLPPRSMANTSSFSMVNVGDHEIVLYHVDPDSGRLVFQGTIEPDHHRQMDGWEGDVWVITLPFDPKVLATWTAPSGPAIAVWTGP
jgi:hypothetical protein